MKSISEIRRENLERALKEKGLSQTELARKMDLPSPSIINQHVRGIKNIGEKFARKYEIYIPLPAFELDSSSFGEVRIEPARVRRPIIWDAEETLGAEFVFVPRLEVKASAGNGKIIWQVEEKGQKQAFRRAWIERLGLSPESLATISADGSSMAPRIEDGDSLTINLHDHTVASGKVYAIALGDELFVKRIFKIPGGGLRIVSDNPDKTRFPDWDLLPDNVESMRIIGRVVAVSGAL